ncbi:unc-13-like C [Paramuricea clavata]|uniref:Unc-13-like C n=1 Tax=Paramuricea clavata TaxID=317549 RepID=A0A6S7ILS6_PARCT|nr:unc-13-like C [Paramuricea clavata]
MNKKLDKLESIEAHLKHVDHDITELKHSLSYMHDTTEELKLKQTSYDDILLKNEEKIGSLEKLASTLKEELIDLRARSMRSNLMFYNLPENDEEDPEKVVSEVLEKINPEFKKMEIERVHRIGKKRLGSVRPIVAKFLRFKDKELIWKNSKKLKGTKIGISEQYPKEIAEERKKLYPIMKEARQNGSKAVMIRDKLYINDQRYFPTR